nr:MAG: capsid protein [Cressdnaviricota sp.]
MFFRKRRGMRRVAPARRVGRARRAPAKRRLIKRRAPLRGRRPIFKRRGNVRAPRTGNSRQIFSNVGPIVKVPSTYIGAYQTNVSNTTAIPIIQVDYLGTQFNTLGQLFNATLFSLFNTAATGFKFWSPNRLMINIEARPTFDTNTVGGTIAHSNVPQPECFWYPNYGLDAAFLGTAGSENSGRIKAKCGKDGVYRFKVPWKNLLTGAQRMLPCSADTAHFVNPHVWAAASTFPYSVNSYFLALTEANALGGTATVDLTVNPVRMVSALMCPLAQILRIPAFGYVIPGVNAPEQGYYVNVAYKFEINGQIEFYN